MGGMSSHSPSATLWLLERPAQILDCPDALWWTRSAPGDVAGRTSVIAARFVRADDLYALFAAGPLHNDAWQH